MFLKFSLLIVQEGLTYEMFADALKLPHGFLLAFQEEDRAKNGVMEKMKLAAMETVRNLMIWQWN